MKIQEEVTKTNHGLIANNEVEGERKVFEDLINTMFTKEELETMQLQYEELLRRKREEENKNDNT